MKYTRRSGVDRNELEAYLQAIKNESLLSASEECILAEAIAGGDKAAFDRMIQANLRLVVRIARDFMGKGLLLSDLIGEGNIGLIRAVERFQPAYGTRFGTYASYWIKQAIRDAVCKSASLIRLPSHVVALMGRLRKAERSLGRELARTPSFDEVALSLDLSESQKLLLTKAQQARQLKLENTAVREMGRWSSVEALDPYGTPDRAIESQDERLLLRSRMKGLDSRERIVLSLRYGLEGEVPMTFREIGDRLGVTREWVRKIEHKAIRKLRGEEALEPNRRWRCSLVTASPRSARERSTRSGRASKFKAKTMKELPLVSRGTTRALPTPPSIPVAPIACIWRSQWPPLTVPALPKDPNCFPNE
jgi:RNA polymerase primary sigma factor